MRRQRRPLPVCGQTALRNRPILSIEDFDQRTRARRIKLLEWVAHLGTATLAELARRAAESKSPTFGTERTTPNDDVRNLLRIMVGAKLMEHPRSQGDGRYFLTRRGEDILRRYLISRGR